MTDDLERDVDSFIERWAQLAANSPGHIDFDRALTELVRHAYATAKSESAALAARVQALAHQIETIRDLYQQERLKDEFYYRNEDSGPRMDVRLCAECDRQGTAAEPHLPHCKVGKFEAALAATR